MLHSRSRREALVGLLGAFLLVNLILSLELHGEESGLDRSRVLEAMRRSATYLHDEVAYRGGYAYFYSESLDRRWGEGEVALDTIVVQPPGTPAVGMTLLDAYEATKENLFLDAAKDAARALVLGQLKSGGWSQTIHFGEAKRRGDYRRMEGGEWNASSLDDDQTQSALRFLIRIDKLLKFEDVEIHQASLDGLKSLLEAQFANGAFPQVWTKAAKPYPVMGPQLPSESWRTDARIKNYWDYYTLNDGLVGTVAQTLIGAHQTYDDELYLNSLRKLGDFLVLAQMPEPQPAWAQQYDDQMRPMWARKFEPPAIAGLESQDAIETLMEIARYTSDDKYLKPIPTALAYLKRSELPDGKLARFYELRTNKPLYMDDEYRVTYDSNDAPGHYSWEQKSRIDKLSQRYQLCVETIDTKYEVDWFESKGSSSATNKISDKKKAALAATAAKAVDSLSAKGAWVSTFQGEKLVGQPKFPKGFRYLSSDQFSQNMAALIEYYKVLP